MLKNYIIVALRNMVRHKGHSIINILGLSVGIACCILVLLWAQNELSYDRYHSRAEDIYRVVKEYKASGGFGQSFSAMTVAPLGPEMERDFAEVELAARVSRTGNQLVSVGDKHFLEKDVFWVDPNLFKIFSWPTLQGDASQALRQPDSVVISASIARKYFADQNPLGQTIRIKDDIIFKVGAVMADMPSNSHFQMEIAMPFMTYIKIFWSGRSNHWGSNSFYTYVRLREGTDPATVNDGLGKLLQKHSSDFAYLKHERLFLQPMLRIHLYSDLSSEIAPQSNAKILILFIFIAFLILLIACINYINLATARSSWRFREVGLRKVVGAQRGQLISQFWGESLLISTLAALVSLLLVHLALPVFNRLIEKELYLGQSNPVQYLPWFFAIIIVTGILGGSYPSFYISRFQPVTVLKGNTGGTLRKSHFRNVLVVFQFTVSIALIITTMVVRDQLHFIRNKEMGFNRDHIVVIPLRDAKASRSIGALKMEMEEYPDILGTTASLNLPNDVDSGTMASWPGRPEGLTVPISVGIVDSDFVDVFGLKIVQGRNFSNEFPADQKGAFLVNQAAVKKLGWQNPIGMELGHWGNSKPSGRVVGVIADFHQHSLHEDIGPLYLFHSTGNISYLSIRIAPRGIPATIEHIRRTMDKFSPRFPFEYNFFDEIFDKTYKKEQKMADMFEIFSLIAVFVASLGLLGLAAYTAQLRTREIGIRKVLGARESQIVALMALDLNRWVVAASLIAWPVTYLIMKNWLQNFAYRTPINPLLFLMAGGLALFIASLTVTVHALRAAKKNPVDTLRYE